MSNSSRTMRSLPRTTFFRMILIATRPSGPSASLTIPYVPAPRVRPNRYFALDHDVLTGLRGKKHPRGRRVGALFVVALRLPMEAVKHVRDYMIFPSASAQKMACGWPW